MLTDELETLGAVIFVICVGLTLYCIICWDTHHKPFTLSSQESED